MLATGLRVEISMLYPTQWWSEMHLGPWLPEWEHRAYLPLSAWKPLCCLLLSVCLFLFAQLSWRQTGWYRNHTKTQQLSVALTLRTVIPLIVLIQLLSHKTNLIRDFFMEPTVSSNYVKPYNCRVRIIFNKWFKFIQVIKTLYLSFSAIIWILIDTFRMWCFVPKGSGNFHHTLHFYWLCLCCSILSEWTISFNMSVAPQYITISIYYKLLFK